MALLHDIGDTLGAYNHADIAAAILKPFVSPDLHWIVEHHGIFQGYNFFHYIGLDRNKRDMFRGHPQGRLPNSSSCMIPRPSIQIMTARRFHSSNPW